MEKMPFQPELQRATTMIATTTAAGYDLQLEGQPSGPRGLDVHAA